VALIIVGLLLWAGVHLIPALAPGLKSRWLGALGKAGYRGSFSVLILLALGLMIAGWRQALPMYLYTLPENAELAAVAIMLLACILFVSAKLPTRVKRIVRHPQLTAVALWGLAHLLANGDSRSAAVFGSMLIWAMVEMVAINRRDGKATPPVVKALPFELVPIALGGALFLALIVAHPYLTGIKLG